MVAAPPYNPGNVPAVPFTSAERTAIRTWIESVKASGDVNFGTQANQTLASGTDAQLRSLFIDTWYLYGLSNAPITGPVPAIKGSVNDALQNSSIGHVLGDLTSTDTWIRVAEALGGFILLAIGAHALVASSTSPNSRHTLGQSAKKIIPAAGIASTVIGTGKKAVTYKPAAFKTPPHHTKQPSAGSRSGSIHVDRKKVG